MRKRIAAFALILMLTFLAIASAMASDIKSRRDILSVATIGSQLYLLDEEGQLTTRTLASSEEELLADVGVPNDGFDENSIIVNSLFEQEGKLFGLDIQSGILFELVNEQGEYAPVKQDVVLDASAMCPDQDEYSSIVYPTSLFARNGWLYYAAFNKASNVSLSGRISLTTGAHTAFRTESIKELAPYQDGKLLALIYDQTSMDTGMGSSNHIASVGVFDPEGDTLEPTVSLETEETLFGFYISGICYAEGQLYYRDSARIMCMDLATGEKRVSAYTGDSTHSSIHEKACSINDYYIVYGYEGIKIRKLDSEYLDDGALMVYGEYGTPMHKTFSANYPDIPVDIGSNTTLDLETLAQTMVSESQTLDVLLLNVTYAPVDELAEKGYCLDLSEYPEIASRIETMYPQYLNVLMVDGKLCGVPVMLYSETFGVWMPVWESLGFGEEDLPTSIIELLDFVANWVDDYGDEFPDIMPFDHTPMETVLLETVLNQYMLYKEHNGEPIRFDTPEFKQLMDAYEQIDFDELSVLEQKNEAVYNSRLEFLFTHSCQTGEYFASWYDGGLTVMPLPLFGEDDPLIWADLSVMIINPKTTRLKQSVAYMTNYLDNLDDRSANITLYPDHNDPVENEAYESTMQYYTAMLEDAKTRLETASPETMANAKTNVKLWEEELAAAAETRYSIPTEVIAWYRENIHPHLVIQRKNPLYSGIGTATTEMDQLISRYMDGAITSEQMAKEFDARLQMMELEE